MEGHPSQEQLTTQLHTLRVPSCTPYGTSAQTESGPFTPLHWHPGRSDC